MGRREYIFTKLIIQALIINKLIIQTIIKSNQFQNLQIQNQKSSHIVITKRKSCVPSSSELFHSNKTCKNLKISETLEKSKTLKIKNPRNQRNLDDLGDLRRVDLIETIIKKGERKKMKKSGEKIRKKIVTWRET